MRDQALAGRRFALTVPRASHGGADVDHTGLVAAIAAYSMWGFMPVFFRQLEHVSALEIIAHRVIWAVPLLILIMAARRQLAEYFTVLKSWAMLRWMLLSALLISTNWLVYVLAVNSGQILAASLGYYLNPLMNVLLGTMFLGERLTRRQWAAVGMAGVAVAVLAAGAIGTLWISLTLAVSFGLYGFVRKLAPVGAVPGLAVETSLLLPLSMGAAFWFIFQTGSAGWTGDTRTMAYLAAGGAVTATPLILFAIAARRMSYSLLGFIQYIGPTIQFVIGIYIYGEELNEIRLVAFALIWAGLVLFSSEALKKHRLA
ncbi:MAG: EamA family transporter RarD [Sphingorhabdus sp.]